MVMNPSVVLVHPPGCTHFIIGRDMAGSKSSVTGEDFYGAYDAQEMANKHCQELGMQVGWRGMDGEIVVADGGGGDLQLHVGSGGFFLHHQVVVSVEAWLPRVDW